MHPTGFEPVTFLRKWIMSPVPSTTRSRVQFWNLWDLNPCAYVTMSIPKGPMIYK